MNPDNSNLTDEDITRLSFAFNYANELLHDIFTVVKNKWGKQARYENMYVCLENIKHFLDLVYKPESEGESINDRSSY